MVEDLYTPEQLEQMHQQLWNYVLQFANFSAAQERHRIARDLHDSLGHALTAVHFQLQTAMKLCQPNPSQAQEFLNEAHRLVAIASQEMRHSVRTLRDEASEQQSFEALLNALIHDFQRTTGIVPTLEMQLLVELPQMFKVPLYRVMQESLNNICKYAQATAVQIDLSVTDTQLLLQIQDNGQGFERDLEEISAEADRVAGGYGLRGMRERLAVLQGTLTIETEPGAGCKITAEVPMQHSHCLNTPVQSSVEIGAWQALDLDDWRVTC